MPDRGIQIVVALLEKREQYVITKESNAGLVNELLRAEQLGYVQKEEKSGKYTLSEKGCRLVYSGYGQGYDFEEDTTPVIDFPTPPIPIPAITMASEPTTSPANKADLRPAYASAFAITTLFLVTVLVIWLFDLAG